MKKLAIIVSSIILAVSLAACNKQVVDLTYSYERAIISLPIFFYKKGVMFYVALYLYRAFGCGIGLGRV